jgi:hypothetical protein
MWLLLGLLLQTAAPATQAPSPPPDPPALVVQAVDPMWLPIPGIRVLVRSRDGGVDRWVQTNRLGFAEFSVPRDAEYEIEASHPGFKTAHLKRVRIGRLVQGTPTAYVQLRLERSGSLFTVE